jgi:hypothetical protein
MKKSFVVVNYKQTKEKESVTRLVVVNEDPMRIVQIRVYKNSTGQ